MASPAAIPRARHYRRGLPAETRCSRSVAAVRQSSMPWPPNSRSRAWGWGAVLSGTCRGVIKHPPDSGLRGRSCRARTSRRSCSWRDPGEVQCIGAPVATRDPGSARAPTAWSCRCRGTVRRSGPRPQPVGESGQCTSQRSSVPLETRVGINDDQDIVIACASPSPRANDPNTLACQPDPDAQDSISRVMRLMISARTVDITAGAGRARVRCSTGKVGAQAGSVKTTPVDDRDRTARTPLSLPITASRCTCPPWSPGGVRQDSDSRAGNGLITAAMVLEVHVLTPSPHSPRSRRSTRSTHRLRISELSSTTAE
jgi:hypothetical protein